MRFACAGTAFCRGLVVASSLLFLLARCGTPLHAGAARRQAPRVAMADPVGAPAGVRQVADASHPATFFVYVGTYTGASSRGIYLFRLDVATGALRPLGVAAVVANPAFLAVHPNHRFLYAVSEVTSLEEFQGGAVSAFALNPQTGALALLNQVSSGGAGPCHLVVDRRGQNVLVANYGSGSVAVLPLGEDGRLGQASTVVQHRGSSVHARQKGPHAHDVNVDAANRFAFASDLGLDKILIYRFDADRGKLAANDPPWVTLQPGSGPRHFCFHPSGRYAYVINELASTVTALEYDPSRGALEPIQTVTTLPADFHGDSTTAEIEVSPSGRFLYGSNRGHDSIVVFAIDAGTGKLSCVQHEPTRGKTPRNFALDPTGTYLLAANQESNSIVVLRIDPATGHLAPTGHLAEVPTPVCVKMVPVGR